MLYLFLLFLITGAFIGSFLNVLIDRLPRNESIAKGRSYCESCKRKLPWYDLIPLFSFILIKGKCRRCRTSLSLYYPIVELTTGVLFTLTFIFLSAINIKYELLSMNSIAELVYYLFLLSALIVVFFTDLKYGIIPDKIIFPAIFISFIYLIFQSPDILVSNLLSAMGAFLFFFLIFILTKGKGMGFGDVKLVFLMGIALGFPNIIIAFYLAFLTGALISLILVAWGKKKLHGGTIPFGPFLVLGTFLAIFLGEKIIKFFPLF